MTRQWSILHIHVHGNRQFRCLYEILGSIIALLASLPEMKNVLSNDYILSFTIWLHCYINCVILQWPIEEYVKEKKNNWITCVWSLVGWVYGNICLIVPNLERFCEVVVQYLIDAFPDSPPPPSLYHQLFFLSLILWRWRWNWLDWIKFFFRPEA